MEPEPPQDSLEPQASTPGDGVDEIMALVEGLNLPTLIVETSRIATWADFVKDPTRMNDSAKSRARQGFRASYAVNKISSYLDALGRINAQRAEITRRLQPLFDAAEDAEDPEAAMLDLESFAFAQSGDQEILIHFYVICVTRIARLVPMATAGSGATLTRDQAAILDAFKPLRHYFEHAENHITSRRFMGDVYREISTETGWRAQIGFRTDEQGRVKILDDDGQERIVECTSRGVRAVEAVVDALFADIRARRLSTLRKLLVSLGDDRPPIEWIDPRSLGRVQGPETWGRAPFVD